MTDGTEIKCTMDFWRKRRWSFFMPAIRRLYMDHKGWRHVTGWPEPLTLRSLVKVM